MRQRAEGRGRKSGVERYATPALLVATLLVAACATRPELPKQVTAPELVDKELVCEVIGHLYRWYLDEVDVQKATKTGNDTIWVRQLCPDLDPGDKSLFGEIVLPALGVSVLLKKADYTIEELDVKVISDRFKIVRVSRIRVPGDLAASHLPVVISGDELRAYLFNRRGDVAFPDDTLVARLRAAVRSELEQHISDTGKKLPGGVRTVHCAPLSPVANELWVFWEAGQVLIRFASDLDLANPHVWEHEELSARIYDIDQQVVVSLQEKPGSNAYLTRDQVGRALYNCVILGRRMVLEQLGEAGDGRPTPEAGERKP